MHWRGHVLRRRWRDAAHVCLTIRRWAAQTDGRLVYAGPPLSAASRKPGVACARPRGAENGMRAALFLVV